MVVPNKGNRLQPGGVEMTFQSGEEEWVFMSKVASGDEAAIAELYDAFGALVFKSARQVLTRRAEAERSAGLQREDRRDGPSARQPRRLLGLYVGQGSGQQVQLL